MFSGFTGWHMMIVLGVLVLVALAVLGIYWVARLGARRGALDAKRDDRN
jgi:uncharacterized membrane protein